MIANIEPIFELHEIVSLLTECGLPVADILQSESAHFFGIRSESGLVAVVGLEQFGTVALLRSLAIISTHRGHGLARQLLAHIESVAATRGIASLFLLTTTAADFFIKLGFVSVSRPAAPPAIRATTQFSGLCPATSAFLHKTFAIPRDIK